MFRTLIASLAIVAVVGVVGAGIPPAQANDVKSIAGSTCSPKILAKSGDFKYAGGAIINTTWNRRWAECTILRDHHAGNTSALDEVRILVNRSTRASLPFTCTIAVRNLADGSVFDSEVVSTSATGNQILAMTFQGVRYPAQASAGDNIAENHAITIGCKVPAKSRLRGIAWEEDDLTDTDAP